jgi:DNA helicase HerA-like ATPase
MDQLAAFRRVDFDWTMHLDAVWNAAPYDVEHIHGAIRRELDDRVARLSEMASPLSPLGVVIVGRAGAGKTHLLGALRRQTQAADATFVLADLTDVHDFWETLALGWLKSLQRPGATGVEQYRGLLAHVLVAFPPEGAASMTVSDLSSLRPPKITNTTDAILRSVAIRHKAEEWAHQDVLRALVLMASNDHDLRDLGYGWLEAIPMEEDERRRHGFRQRVRKPREVVEGLSWLASLRGPTVLALDQLDAIVSEHNIAAGLQAEDYRDRQQAALVIIEGIAGGLMALRDVTRRTLVVISCLESTWHVLESRALASATDRYNPPLLLSGPRESETVRDIVRRRLADGYTGAGFSPPYPTWPFRAESFAALADATPREVLKKWEEHRRHCVHAGQVTEVISFNIPLSESASFGSEELEAIDARFDTLKAAVKVEALFLDDHEKDADAIVESVARALIVENEPGKEVDASVDVEFAGSRNHDPLHARIRLIYRQEGDREHHAALRYLTHADPRAFQARLKSAITASGIDRNLPFRALFVFRATPPPKGDKSQQLCEQFEKRGGRFLAPTDQDLRAMQALRLLLGERPSGLDDWLRARRTASNLSAVKPIAEWLFARRTTSSVRPPVAGDGDGVTTPLVEPAPRPAGVSPAPAHLAGVRPPSRSHGPDKLPHQEPADAPFLSDAFMPLGRRLVAGQSKEIVGVPLGSLAKHTIVLAGAGSGKTVLVRRIVEEAVLRGIPSIVLDVANDLATLGDRWPARPPSWTDEDAAKAVAYESLAEVVVWTPGSAGGNPLRLDPLPDFAPLLGSPEEFDAALSLAVSTLRPIVLTGKSTVATPALGILTAALQFFARRGGGSLSDLIDLLSDLPADAATGFANAATKARDMGERLRAEVMLNPVLKPGGAILDPARLLRPCTRGRVRVSVLNLAGLGDLGPQQQFVNQLAMTLFAWIKKNPARDGVLLSGLLVVDEARDFVPSGKTVASSDSLVRLAAQARKYGLGIVFATQQPKSINHNVIANCQTQIYGRASSPAAIDVIVDQIHQRGGSGSDVAALQKGQFYVHGEGLPVPIKVVTSLCLSHHGSAPDENGLRERAVRSRALVQ